MRALITGGAGFIGSHLADALLARGAEVVVLDNLSAGRTENVPGGAELVVADVSDREAVGSAVTGCRLVFHQAAHRSVSRSVEYPLETDRTNTAGTLTVLDAAREAGVRRVVSASSSSVYGGAELVPTPESAPLEPRSPYAVSKLAGEQYCRVFHELHGLETVSLRYFNVFGPRQRADSQYAAVIPLFIRALLDRTSPTVHGDGRQSRGFTFISDVVTANLDAASAPAERCSGRAYNIASSHTHDLLDLLAVLQSIIGVTIAPVHTEPRAGDVRRSHGDITAACTDLGWQPVVAYEEGLRATVNWLEHQAQGR